MTFERCSELIDAWIAAVKAQRAHCKAMYRATRGFSVNSPEYNKAEEEIPGDGAILVAEAEGAKMRAQAAVAQLQIQGAWVEQKRETGKLLS